MDDLAENSALQPLHDDEQAAVLGLVEVVDERDSGVALLVQRRHELGLLPEPRYEPLVPSKVPA